jgi:hypothetical protein
MARRITKKDRAAGRIHGAAWRSRKAKPWPTVWRTCDECGTRHEKEDWVVGTDCEFICIPCIDKEHVEFVRKFPFLCPENEKHYLLEDLT